MGYLLSISRILTNVLVPLDTKGLTIFLTLCRFTSMGTDKFRITTQTLNVLGALVSSRDEISGADIARLTRISSGTLYPILMRLEHHKWIESEWEDGDPRKLGRPRRRLYQVTALGARSARKEFKEIKAAIGRPAWGIS